MNISRNTSSIDDLTALKKSMRCLKDESCDEPSASSGIGSTIEINDSTININRQNENFLNNKDDDEFCAEARGRCYTWPVAATQQQPLPFGQPCKIEPTVSNSDANCSSVYLQQNPSQQSLSSYESTQQNFINLSNSASTASVIPVPPYTSSQPDLCNSDLSNYAYLRSMCNSSPSFVPHEKILSLNHPLRLQFPFYFGSEASCSYSATLNSNEGNIQNLNNRIENNFNYRLHSPQNSFNTSSILNPSDSSINLTAKGKKRGRKSENLNVSPELTGLNNSVTNSTANFSQKKPNAWGTDSYAELIEKAILSSPNRRLKLNEIYDWFIENIPYFCKRSSQDGAVGWKNSIRHNLSLHSRFMRIQNEGAGKSSWWVINPEAKPGRNPRRRAATLEAATKVVMDKKRRGAKKRIEMNMRDNKQEVGSQPTLSENLYDNFGPDEEILQVVQNGSNFESFRPRNQSLLLIGNSSRLTPTQEPPGFEDFDFPIFRDANNTLNGALPVGNNVQGNNGNTVSEILDRTDQIRLDGDFVRRPALQTLSSNTPTNGVKIEPDLHQNQTTAQQQTQNQQPLQQAQQLQSQKQQPNIKTKNLSSSAIKQEPINGVVQPLSFQELNVVRAPSQMQQNPLLRSQLQQAQVIAVAAQQQQSKLAEASTRTINYYNNNTMFNVSQPSTIQPFNNSGPLHWQPSVSNQHTSQTSSNRPFSATNSQISTHTQPNYLMMNSCGISTNSYCGGPAIGYSSGTNGGGIVTSVNTSAGGVMTALPMDLENLSMVGNSMNLADLDMEAVLMHDYERDGHLRFDMP